MKKKIHFQLMGIAAAAIFMTMIIIVAVFYDLFQDQVKEELKTYAELIEEAESRDLFLKKESPAWDSGLRVTLIRQDGTVMFDSDVQEAGMENHGDRPEILAAVKEGEGYDIRTSATVGMNTFYYALLTQDGHILRVAKEANSVWSIFASAFPTLIFFGALLLLVSMVAAHFLTQSLVRPIENLADTIEEPAAVGIYEELIPFITMIQSQHADILKNSMMRQEFTANVSHELKTPLTSISGYAELIETGMASEEDVMRFAKGIHKSANRLLTLINDIIRLSELDANQSEETAEDLNLYQLAQTCVDMLQLNAEKHNVTLTLKGKKEIMVLANRQMIEEVLYNLTDNAIRYNKENGSVVVSVGEQEGKGVLTVEDSGIGIPEEHQERIFERFYRVDKSRSKSTGGTGLGLAIVKHIIKKQGAQLTLESKEGVGTKITVMFANAGQDN